MSGGQVKVVSFGIINDGEYCKKCWSNKKNWPKIHELKTKK